MSGETQRAALDIARAEAERSKMSITDQAIAEAVRQRVADALKSPRYTYAEIAETAGKAAVDALKAIEGPPPYDPAPDPGESPFDRPEVMEGYPLDDREREITRRVAEGEPGPVGDRWQVPFCPDCGMAGRHSDQCGVDYPGSPVKAGNYEWVTLADPPHRERRPEP